MTPLVSFEPKSLHFVYKHDSNAKIHELATAGGMQSQDITITNVTALPLVFWMRCIPPFSAERLEFSLAPGSTPPRSQTAALNLSSRRICGHFYQLHGSSERSKAVAVHQKLRGELAATALSCQISPSGD